MIAYVNFTLEFNQKISKKISETIFEIDYFQFETKDKKTFGYNSNSELTHLKKVRKNHLIINQKYKDIFANNVFYIFEGEEQKIITFEKFKELLKDSELVEIGLYIQDEDFDEEFVIKKIEFETFDIKIKGSENLLVIQSY